MLRKLLQLLVAAALVAAFGATLIFLQRKSEVEPVVYSTFHPFHTSIEQKTVATGSIVPRKEVAVKPQVSGIIEALFVEPGQEVGRGDRIARVRIIPDMVSLSSAENRLNRARIAVEDAENAHERNRALFDRGLIAESEYLEYELALRTAREEVAGAEDNLALIREGARKKSADRTTNTLVTATVSGTVLVVDVEEGDSVIEANTFNDGSTIATIADMDDLIFRGNVDESEVGRIAPGMELQLTVGAIDEARFSAELEYIAPKGVELDGAIQFEIRAAMEQPEGYFLRANYSANADIVLARRQDVLALEERWLQFDDQGVYVEVEVAEQQFEPRRIETGLSDGIRIEVVSGISVDDRVKDPNSAG